MSDNPKYYSDGSESNKFLEDILIPYLNGERKTIQLPSTPSSLLIMDFLRGQMTHVVLNTLQENIFLITVPAHLKYLFQSLDVHGGPNGYVKHFIKNKFVKGTPIKSLKHHSNQITQTLGEEQGIDAIDIPLTFQLSRLCIPNV